MGSSFALVLFILGICGLFFLDRDSSARTSKALWLPVIWLWINGSRPISAWLGMAPQNEAGSELPGTSVIDQLIAGILILVGILVLVRRRREIGVLLRASWPVVLYFLICLISLLWSDFPAWGFKRWVRALGELVMVMIVASDAQPGTALRRLLSSVGFVLLPLSVLLIKYFPNLGRAYEQWGSQMNVGVTTNKNELGVMAFVLTLGAFWQVLRLLRDKKQRRYSRRLLAQFTLLLFGLRVLMLAHSMTSAACFVLGAGLLLATELPLIKQRPRAVHGLIATLAIGAGLTMLLGGEAEITNALGRKPDLTGRTEVWKVVLPMVPNPLVGAGFETFWLGPRVEALRTIFGFVNEAHDGYIEVYLNLGLLGVGLIALILLQGYVRAVAAFRRDPKVGGLLLAYVVTAATYSISEAGFRMLNPIWFFLMFSGIAAGRFRGAISVRHSLAGKLLSQPPLLTRLG